ncbi:hypothetical protein PCL_04991 [Purpureocillium lilacinum]|uniref:Uncharacterized protein n=1 Tax=Purpureocillium lilacinum TaxID=33203 RepID=A0A2U3DWE3_PURLI|nr:hypothetical protein PCL_04991 [Purpureocillium lilacinum]
MNTLTSDESDYHNGDYDDEEDDEEDKDDDEEDKDKDDEDKNKDYEDQDEDKDYEDNKDDDMFGSQGEIKAPSDLDSRLQRCLGDAKSFQLHPQLLQLSPKPQAWSVLHALSLLQVIHAPYPPLYAVQHHSPLAPHDLKQYPPLQPLDLPYQHVRSNNIRALAASLSWCCAAALRRAALALPAGWLAHWRMLFGSTLRGSLDASTVMTPSLPHACWVD